LPQQKNNLPLLERRLKIGIMIPMQEEISEVLKAFEEEKSEFIGNNDFHVGKLFDQSCVLIKSGIGKVNSAMIATILIHHFKVGIIINIGIAGGIGKGVQIGDICIASASVQHDMDCSPIFPRFEIPLTQITRFPTQEWLVLQAQRATKSFLDAKISNFITASDLESFGILNPKVHIGLLGSGISL
jgi:adenosylhomocysteine nucleosidase